MVQATMSNRTFRGSLEALLGKQFLAENSFNPELTRKENLCLFRIAVSPGKLGTMTDFMNRLRDELAKVCSVIRGAVCLDYDDAKMVLLLKNADPG